MHTRTTLTTAGIIIAVLLAFASPASAKGKIKVDLQTTQTAAITAGDTAWVSLMWLAQGDAENVRVTVDKLPDGVTVEYPANTADHSGPMHGYQLSDGELDFTAIRLAVPYGTSDFKLRATVTWEADGKPQKNTSRVTVPITDHQGGDLEQLTTAASIPKGEATWVDVWFSGLAPEIDSFSLSVIDQPDLAITYPGENAATSLHNDAILEDGESDVARILVDAADIGVGIYPLDLTVSYELAGAPGTLDGTLDVQVTG